MKILVLLSAILLFGYWVYLWIRFGIKDCFSRFSATHYPHWSYILFVSAMFLIPPMLELTDGKTLQFVAFLAPVSLFLVAITPRWATSNGQYWLHNAGVIAAVIFSVIFSILFRNLVWFLAGAAVLALIFGLIYKRSWMWFAELAIYSAMYAEITYLLFQ